MYDHIVGWFLSWQNFYWKDSHESIITLTCVKYIGKDQSTNNSKYYLSWSIETPGFINFIQDKTNDDRQEDKKDWSGQFAIV